MNKFVKSIVIMAASLSSIFTPLASASAGDWYYDDDGVIIERHVERRVIQRRHRNDDALAAGIIGLAAGAIIVGALSERQRPVYQPRPVYRQPVYDAYPYAPPAPRRPHVITYADQVEPWTREWYRYCTNRYRSFNPETGTYRGYDGRARFCTAN